MVAAVSGAGLAPYDAERLDWFAGTVPSGVASLRAAGAGRAAKKAHESSGVASGPGFTPADLAELHGDWSWFDSVVGPATQAGPGGLIDDDLAYVAPWAFRPDRVTPPVLLLHGEGDGLVPAAHGVWLAGHCPAAELRRYPEDGRISVLRHAGAALAWLRDRADEAAAG